MRATANDLCEHYGVDRRAITNWLNSDPPCPSKLEKGHRIFDTAEVSRWHAERAARKALGDRDRATPATDTDIRRRRELAATKLAELDLAIRENELVPIELHKEVVSDLCGRLRAVLINVPSNYTLQLERKGMPAQDAQAVLEDIAENLTSALRGVADDMEEDDRSSQ